jgi:hypothetical protein
MLGISESTLVLGNRRGNSLIALIAAFVGGHLSRRLIGENREAVLGAANPKA